MGQQEHHWQRGHEERTYQLFMIRSERRGSVASDSTCRPAKASSGATLASGHWHLHRDLVLALSASHYHLNIVPNYGVISLHHCQPPQTQ
eukprot:3026959-Amphidinium_carterae.1